MDFENIIKSTEDSNSYVVLHLEVHSGNKNIVTKLLSVLSTDLNKLSQLLNAVDKHCQTVLHWAVSNGDTDITELLLEKMNLKDITSITRNLSLPVNNKINALITTRLQKLENKEVSYQEYPAPSKSITEKSFILSDEKIDYSKDLFG
ncbi:ankyrin repeat domain-containing protein [Rickettsia gravesii]|uniref:ankyrin repeat domain-containing protein n=1 Tax=Rickettsia gravesii TaxID=354585 RepID=UPI00036CA7EF|nr:ankyrin repeat domain-containing protein [Rickettsia gravesii]